MDEFHVISTHFLDFEGPKINFVSTYIFRHNFDGWKNDTCNFWRTFNKKWRCFDVFFDAIKKTISKHNFKYYLNPIYSCGLDIECTSHFLFNSPIFNNERCTPLSTLNRIDWKLLELANSSSSQTLLYGNTLFDTEKSTPSLNNYWIYFIHWKIQRASYLVKFHCNH